MGISAGLGSIIGSGLSTIGNFFTNYQNRKSVERENAIMREREDTAIRRRVTDLEAAGLNKQLAAGDPASSQSGQTQNNQNPLESAASAGASVDQTLLQKEFHKAQIDHMKAETELKLADLHERRTENLRADLRSRLDRKQADTHHRDNLRYQDRTLTQADRHFTSTLEHAQNLRQDAIDNAAEQKRQFNHASQQQQDQFIRGLESTEYHQEAQRAIERALANKKIELSNAELDQMTQAFIRDQRDNMIRDRLGLLSTESRGNQFAHTRAIWDRLNHGDASGETFWSILTLISDLTPIKLGGR